MPEFIVVRCFNCEHYQVTQRRADSKFTCKLCGSRQSVRTIQARSHNAAQLRPLVQRANVARGDAEALFKQDMQTQPDSDSETETAGKRPVQVPSFSSRWVTYVDALTKEHFCDGKGKTVEQSSDEPDIITSLPDRQSKRRRRAAQVPDQSVSNTLQNKLCSPRHEELDKDKGARMATSTSSLHNETFISENNCQLVNQHSVMPEDGAAAKPSAIAHANKFSTGSAAPVSDLYESFVPENNSQSINRLTDPSHVAETDDVSKNLTADADANEFSNDWGARWDANGEEAWN